jgi:Flp pilus assembly protein TadB
LDFLVGYVCLLLDLLASACWFWLPTVGCACCLLAASCWICLLASGCWFAWPAAGQAAESSKQQAASSQQQAASSKQQAASSKQQAASRKQKAAGSQGAGSQQLPQLAPNLLVGWLADWFHCFFNIVSILLLYCFIIVLILF